VVESSALLNLKRHFVPNLPFLSSLFNSKPASQLHRNRLFLLRSPTSSYFTPQPYLFDLPFRAEQTLFEVHELQRLGRYPPRRTVRAGPRVRPSHSCVVRHATRTYGTKVLQPNPRTSGKLCGGWGAGCGPMGMGNREQNYEN